MGTATRALTHEDVKQILGIFLMRATGTQARFDTFIAVTDAAKIAI